MHIRLATASDLVGVMSIVRETVEEMAAYGNDQWDATYPHDDRFQLDIDNETLYVADEEGAVLGFITIDQDEPEGYQSIPWRSEGQCLVIHRFAVSSQTRSKGVASFLEAFVCQMAREKGIGHIRVDTHSSNIGMQSFLSKKGYTKVGEMEFLGKDRPFYCYDKLVQ